MTAKQRRYRLKRGYTVSTVAVFKLLMALLVCAAASMFLCEATGEGGRVPAGGVGPPRSELKVTIPAQPLRVSGRPAYYGPSAIDPAKGIGYVVRPGGLKEGQPVYCDRTYVFEEIPEKFRGCTYVQTSNGDRLAYDRFVLTLEVSAPATVCVAYDDRLEDKPAWLKGFDDTGDDILTSDPMCPGFSFYARSYPAGKIILGPNRGIYESAMYFVVLKEAPSPTATPVALATCDRLEGDLPLVVRFSGSVLVRDKKTEGYNWDFGDGSGTSNQQNPVHQFNREGTYLVTLTVTDSEGQRATARIGIQAGPVLPPFDPSER